MKRWKPALLLAAILAVFFGLYGIAAYVERDSGGFEHPVRMKD